MTGVFVFFTPVEIYHALRIQYGQQHIYELRYLRQFLYNSKYWTVEMMDEILIFNIRVKKNALMQYIL